MQAQPEVLAFHDDSPNAALGEIVAGRRGKMRLAFRGGLVAQAEGRQQKIEVFLRADLAFSPLKNARPRFQGRALVVMTFKRLPCRLPPSAANRRLRALGPLASLGRSTSPALQLALRLPLP